MNEAGLLRASAMGMDPAAKPAKTLSPEELRNRILAFIAACTSERAVLKEEGAEIMPLEPGRFSVEVQHGKVLLEAWDDSRSIVRRLTGLRRESEAELLLAYRRFGPGEGLVRILASAKREPELRREVARGRFAERLRKMLAQTFPGWKLERITVERDLHRSFSAQVTRGELVRGDTAWAVAGCSEEEGEAAAGAALTQGLAWLHRLRSAAGERAGRGRKARVVAGLKLFLPERCLDTTALRLPFLERSLAQYELFSFSPDGSAAVVAEADLGNVCAELPSPFPTAGVPFNELELLKALASLPGVELRTRPHNSVECHVRGLVFARAATEGTSFGWSDHWQPLTRNSLAAAKALAGEIEEWRSRRPTPANAEAAGARRRHAYFRNAHPERWLESLLLGDITLLSGELHPAPVYSQVPAMAGQERGIIDLLAARRDGRLVVIEIKASPDPNLVMQALDYWMRVNWYLERGELRRRGYFPGIELRPEPPLLWLVAPVFEFHPLTDIARRYLCRDVPLRRIGLNHEWRSSPQVVHRD